MRKDTELSGLVQALVSLYPGQHPKCCSWLNNQDGRGSSDQATAQTSAGAGNVGRDPDGAKRTKQAPRAVNGKHPDTRAQRAGSRRQAPTAPVAHPSFARETFEDLSEWGERHVKGYDLSWDEEGRLRDKVMQTTGLVDASPGFIGGMLTLLKEWSTPTGTTASIEVFIPRVNDLQLIVVRLSRGNKQKRIFEIPFAAASSQNIRELMDFTEKM